jgi:hypothetical protein
LPLSLPVVTTTVSLRRIGVCNLDILNPVFVTGD